MCRDRNFPPLTATCGPSDGDADFAQLRADLLEPRAQDLRVFRPAGTHDVPHALLRLAQFRCRQDLEIGVPVGDRLPVLLGGVAFRLPDPLGQRGVQLASPCPPNAPTLRS